MKRDRRTKRKSRGEDDDGDEEGDQRIGLRINKSNKRQGQLRWARRGSSRSRTTTHVEPPVSLAEPDDETTSNDSDVSESVSENVKEHT